MSEPSDPKEPEPVRLPAQPPTDTRADFNPLDEHGEIQGKDYSAWNERPHNEPPVETTREPEPEKTPDDSE